MSTSCPAASGSSSHLVAWAMDTDIFLLDEPTANLDFAATQQLKEILLALKKQGKTLLLSEHRLYYLAGHCSTNFGSWQTARSKENILPQRQRRSQWSGDKHFLCARSTLRRSPCRRKSRCENRADGACRLRCLLYLRQEGRRYPLWCQLFRREHEIVGLVGANGCGKTTIGKLIAGLCRPSGGRIMLFGKSQNPKQLQKQVLFILQEAEFQFFTGSVLHELQYGHAVTPEFEAKRKRC